MTLLQQIERIRYMHHLILNEKTGMPHEFAEKINLSRRQIFHILDEFKTLGIEIKYDKRRETYYYSGEKYLHVDYSLKEISESEARKVTGGEIIIAECYETALYEVIFATVI